ncbi:MAG: TlpA family protein disulfide reductase [Verrucomicrobia bacterium]|nr:MAG: TlpA family protein disulfide reductase [Verrucomicrobiota bacterium]
MRTLPLALATVLGGALFLATNGFAQDLATEANPSAETSPPTDVAAPEPANIQAELTAVVQRIRAKLKEGFRNEADFAAELGELDSLMVKHAGSDLEDVAQIGDLKARFYIEVLEDYASGIAHLETVARDFPDSDIAAEIPTRIAELKSQQAREAITAVGQPFPPFKETGTDGSTVDLAAYKGKIVLIDFWATWCGPCIEEIPVVLETHKKFRDQGFEVIGISLDQDSDALAAFVKKHQLSWPQICDGLGWKSKLAQANGIQSIPATLLLDRDGIILAKNLRGDRLPREVESALAKTAD